MKLPRALAGFLPPPQCVPSPWWASAQGTLAPAQLPARVAAIAEEITQFKGQSWDWRGQSRDCIWMEQGAIAGAHRGGGKGAVPSSDWNSGTIPMHSEHTILPLLIQNCSPLGQRCYCWKGGECTLRGNGTGSNLTLRASAPISWNPPLPPIGWWWCWA